MDPVESQDDGDPRADVLTVLGPGAPAPDAPSSVPAATRGSAATLAAIVIGMLAAAVYRQGAFYPHDAFGVAVVSGVLVVIALIRFRGRAAIAVTAALGGLTLWWFVRALSERHPAAFLPFGASLLGFLAAFLVVKALDARERTRLAMAIILVASLAATVGLLGVLWRWHPLALPSGTFWRLATTLTYPAAAAGLLIIALLVAMALDIRAAPVRVAVCLCLAALIGTQSHWALVALACGALAVPVRRWYEARWPLAMGLVAGLAVEASASGHWPRWQSSAAVLLLAAASVARARGRSGAGVLRGVAAAIVVVGCAALVISLSVSGPPQPPNQSQTLAWSAAAHSWRTSVFTGVGPPVINTSDQPVDVYPGLTPDSYLTVTAEGGLVGVILLVGVGAIVVAACRRRDLISSCASGAAIAFAITGVVDFDWQLPALAIVGGCVAGLASATPGAAVVPSAEGGPLRSWRPRIRYPALWSAAAVVLVSAQLIVGFTHDASGLSHVQSAPPSPSTNPQAPGRYILTGPDVTDPYMLEWQGLYYIYTSEGTTFMNVPLRIGTRPGHWRPPVNAMPTLPSWADGGRTWAPEVHQVAGGWALYFSAVLRGVRPLTHCIGSAFATSPAGPFVPTPQTFICQLDHRGSIDARVFVDRNRLVMLWKSEDNANPSVPGPDQNGNTGIYAQGLSADGRTLLGQPIKILSPTQPWENTIVEAPDMIEAWGTYWLFFSGNWYYSPSYGIGVAACQSPFGPCSDVSPTPFIGSNLQGLGPGEESVFLDGSSVYLLYNPFRANDPGPDIPRPVVMTRLGFTPQGPYLAAP